MTRGSLFLLPCPCPLPGLPGWARRLTITGLQRTLQRCRGWRVWSRAQVRRVEIILAGDADEREQGIAAGVGQRGAHALRIGSLGDRTDPPVRRDSIAGGMGERGG